MPCLISRACVSSGLLSPRCCVRLSSLEFIVLLIAMSGGPLQSSSLKRARPAWDMRIALYVGNLPSDVSVSELEELCGEFGHVKQCDVLFQWKSGKSRRFAFVLMTTNDEALDVIDALDNTKYGGSFLRVQFWRSDVFPRRTSGNPTLYVQNLPYASTEREVMHHFSESLRRNGHGVDFFPYDIIFCFDAPRRRFTGCAYLRFWKYSHTEIAYYYCSREVIRGRVIKAKFPR